MEKGSKKRVALLMLPIIIFFIFISVSYALDIPALVKVIPKPFEIEITHPRNTTYHVTSDKNDILLIFKINNRNWRSYKTAYWMGYSLDGSPIIQLKDYRNLIIDVSPGTHKITVYANDTAGNKDSSEIYFTLKKIQCRNLFLFKVLKICL